MNSVGFCVEKVVIFGSMLPQVFCSVYDEDDDASENVDIAERVAILVYQGGHPRQGHRSGSGQVSFVGSWEFRVDCWVQGER